MDQFPPATPQRQKQSVERYTTVRRTEALSKRYGLKRKAVAKWNQRTSTSGLKGPKSTAPSVEKLPSSLCAPPLGDCLYACG